MLKFLSYLMIFTFCSENVYSYTNNIKSIYLSAAAYCSPYNITFPSIINDFKLKNVIYNSGTDIQAYTGILPSEESIVLSFRGSVSITNWVENLDFKMIPYPYNNNNNEYVHMGFYNSMISVEPIFLQQLSELKKEYPSYSILITGHSLGGAIAVLAGLDVRNIGLIEKDKLFIETFGQPRIGNTAFSEKVDNMLNLHRYTHYKDIIPHLPPIEFGFLHSLVEIYENKSHITKECKEKEDLTCSIQFSILQTNINDHHIYLNHTLNCGEL